MKKLNLEGNLNLIEFIFLVLTIIFIPSIEAPKNIFLALFLLTSISRQIIDKSITSWKPFDLILLIYLSSAFISALYPGIPNGAEWKGFRGMFAWALFGWGISRLNCKKDNLIFLIKLSVYSVIPPLLWGIMQFKYFKANEFQLHSVGNVNHSAIYLTIISGALIGLINNSKSSERIIKYLTLFLISYALIITQSRIAIFIFIFLLLIIDFLKTKKKIFVITNLKIFLIIFVSSIFISNANVINKQIEAQNTNNILSGREGIWLTAIESSRIYPLLGVGNGNWNKISLEQLKKSVEQRGAIFDEKNYKYPVAHAHSLFLSNLAERGWLGIIALSTFMIFWIFTLTKKSNGIKRGSVLWVASLSAFIGTFGIGLFNSTFHHEEALLAYLYLGIYINMLNKDHSQNNRLTKLLNFNLCKSIRSEPHINS